MIKKQKTAKETAARSLPPKAVETASSNSKASFFIVLLLIIFMVAIALMISSRFKHKPAVNPTVNQAPTTEANKPAPMAKDEIQTLIQRVSRLISVKQDEEPTVATVQDADALRQSNPVFYKEAQNGDRLLVWSDKAILYSTSQDKLLAVMPIMAGEEGAGLNQSTSTPATQTSASSTGTVASENATIDVRNGTTVAGQARKMADELKAKDFKVGLISDAVSRDYATTTIYKVSDKPLTATIQALQSTISAQVVAMTDAQAKAYGGHGDIVVIVGKDYSK